MSTDTLRTIKTVPVGPMPYGVATTIDGARILVSNRSSGSVAFIDSREMRVLQQAKVGRFREGIVVEPRGSKAYVANWFSGDVTVLDVASGRELKRICTGGGARTCAVIAARAYTKWASGRHTPMKRARRRLTHDLGLNDLLCLVAAGASAAAIAAPISRAQVAADAAIRNRACAVISSIGPSAPTPAAIGRQSPPPVSAC